MSIPFNVFINYFYNEASNCTLDHVMVADLEPPSDT